jgi:hypothetical protein
VPLRHLPTPRLPARCFRHLILCVWTCSTRCRCVRQAVHFLFTLLFLLFTNNFLIDWARANTLPLPATQMVPTSFVEDGLVPALYAKALFKCHACIVLKKICHSHSMNVSCEECNASKHNCSNVATPARFFQRMEDLRPMLNLRPEGASSYFANSLQPFLAC